eukprot:8417849-Pyramimonas_sp.AAC.1
MMTSKSNQPPLRTHFSFQTNMAKPRIWTTQKSHRARGVARGEFRIVHNREVTMLTWKCHRSPIRAHALDNTKLTSRARGRER